VKKVAEKPLSESQRFPNVLEEWLKKYYICSPTTLKQDP
jgi:hypothetical protein